MSTMKAVITDPLKPKPKYQAAAEKVETLKAKAKAAKGTPRAERLNQRLSDAKAAKRSIKNKYSDKRANVVEFDTRWMLDKVKEILSPNHALNQAWDLMHESNSQLNTLLDGVNQIGEMAANSQALLQQDAMRMSLLLGAPLPEKAAGYVLTGDQRQEIDPRDRGRRSLRIDQTPSPSLAI